MLSVSMECSLKHIFLEQAMMEGVLSDIRIRNKILYWGETKK